MEDESTIATRRSYSEQDKAEAVSLAREVGIRPAARQLGIPHGTVHRWVKKARESAPGADAESSVAATTEPKGTTRVAKVYTPSQRARILKHAAKHGVTVASKKYGASRWTIVRPRPDPLPRRSRACHTCQRRSLPCQT